MPDDYKVPRSSAADIKIISVAWGFQLGFTILTSSKAASQTIKIWKRTRRITGYMAMVWCEILTNAVLGVLGFLFIIGVIAPGYVDINV